MYLKKKFTTILKIVVVCLVIVCGGYCFLSGGISNAIDNVENGDYFAFIHKSEKEEENSWNKLIDEIKTEVDTEKTKSKTEDFNVIITCIDTRSWAEKFYYTGKISKEKFENLEIDLKEHMYESEFYDVMSKYRLTYTIERNKLKKDYDKELKVNLFIS